MRDTLIVIGLVAYAVGSYYVLIYRPERKRA